MRETGMNEKRTALLVCADGERSRTIINALISEHDIWHVARQRDAMAYLVAHRPEIIVLDLDFLGQDAITVVEAIRMAESGVPSFIIGLTKDPEHLHPSAIRGIDQILAHS
jgi:CheY-like chemotaxis protein